MKSFVILHIAKGYYLTDGHKAIKLVANDYFAAMEDAKHKARQWHILASEQTAWELKGHTPSARFRFTARVKEEN